MVELIRRWLVFGKLSPQQVLIASLRTLGFSSSKKLSTEFSMKYTVLIAKA